nr:MAG TPA: hypothetical protein [Caudoviricetes sp.]
MIVVNLLSFNFLLKSDSFVWITVLIESFTSVLIT